jgi:hypothetical protein
MKIHGNTVSTTMLFPDWDEVNEKMSSYIKNKPRIKAGADDKAVVMNKDTEAYGGGSFASGGGCVAGVSLAKYKEMFSEALAGKSEEEISQLYEEARERSTLLDGETFNTIGFKYWFAHAEGDVSKAAGRASHSEGFANHADNDFAHAEGARNKSRGVASHTEGSNNEANALNAHAEGEVNVVNGANSHGEGYGNTVAAPNAHAEGRGNTISEKAEGAHAEGGWNTASASFSHIEGQRNTATAAYTHIEGLENVASHSRAHVEGQNNKSSSANQHVLGKYNADNPNSVVIVGSGSLNERKNAYELDWNGCARYAGTVTVAPPTLATHATTKAYVDGAVSGFADRLDALEAIAHPSPFVADDSVTYAKTVPYNALPYAMVLEIGGMSYVTKNLYNEDALKAESGNTYASESGNTTIYVGDGYVDVSPESYWDRSAYYTTTAKFKDIFPDAVIGKRYTLSYDMSYSEGALGGYGGHIHPSGTFVLTESIYNSGLTIGIANCYEQADTYGTLCTYTNIALVEEGKKVGDRYDAKVTSVVSRDASGLEIDRIDIPEAVRGVATWAYGYGIDETKYNRLEWTADGIVFVKAVNEDLTSAAGDSGIRFTMAGWGIDFKHNGIIKVVPHGKVYFVNEKYEAVPSKIVYQTYETEA